MPKALMYPAPTSAIYGIPTKYVSLLTLVVQNSALVLTMRYSRTQPGPRYLSSTAVVVSESLKCIICLLVHLREQYTKPSSPELPLLTDTPSASTYSLRQLYTDIFSRQSGFFRLLIPACLYTLQNNLQFVAASNLYAATFQVTYQCKILTTALFAVLLLGQSLSYLQWVSLLILTLGVACVQIPSGTATSSAGGNYFVGLIAVAVACLCSGFAGVYFEKVLKTASGGITTSLWIRNIQLSVGCLAIALCGTFAWDGPQIVKDGFFYGYNPIVVLTICIQAAGGLIVALVIKYADNILKGFATSLSIILSTVASVFIFNFVVTGYFLVGSLMVFTATYLYSKPERKETVEVKGKEEVPILVVDDYDEKMDEEKRRGYRDESDLESGSGSGSGSRRDSSSEESPEWKPSLNEDDSPGSRDGGESRPLRNFSPSMLQQAFEKEERRRGLEEGGLAS